MLVFLEVALTGIIGFLSFMFKGHLKLRDAVAELKERIKTLEVVWALTGKQIAKALHSPHTPELDRLLEKFWSEQIERHEITDLIKRLIELNEDKSSPHGERVAAGLLLGQLVGKYKMFELIAVVLS